MIEKLFQQIAVFLFAAPFSILPSFGQLSQYQHTHTYSTTNGLPSNHIYKCLQDKRGFIWIATENGLSRFNGNKFTNFSTRDGLPDNEIIDIISDKYDNIWIIPFSGRLTYFDTKRNKIITPAEDSLLSKIDFTKNIRGNKMPDGSVAFYDRKGNYFFIVNTGIGIVKRVVAINETHVTSVYNILNDTFYITASNVYKLENGKEILAGKIHFGNSLQILIPEEKDYVIYSKESTKIMLHQKDKPHSKLIEKEFSLKFWQLNYYNEKIFGVGTNQKIYTIQPSTLAIEDSTIAYPNIINFFPDRNGNCWLGTTDDGLIKLSLLPSKKIDIEPRFQKKYKALQATADEVLAADDDGNILFAKKKKNTSLRLPGIKGTNTVVVKKIITVKNKIFIVSYNGLFRKNGNSFERITGVYGFKDGVAVNDSIIALSSYQDMGIYNCNTNKFTSLYKGRTTAVAYTENKIYFGSLEGLYVWEQGKEVRFLGEGIPALNKRITKLFSNAKEQLVWVATPTDTIYGLHYNSIVCRIPIANLNNSSYTTALSGEKPGQLWIGTDKTITCVNYSLNNNTVTYTAAPLIFNSSPVNDISVRNDTVYYVSGDGVFLLPANSKADPKKIPVFITNLFVNNKAVEPAPHIKLNYTYNNLRIIYSGVEPGGYDFRYVYRINQAPWIPAKENELMLNQLSPGKYEIEIGAINSDNTVSEDLAKLTVEIKKPFWQYSAFYFILLSLAVLSTLFLLYQRKNRNKRRELKQQILLEQQRNKITADLHDDIGSSLSSLQINSAVAEQLMERDPQRAKEVIKKVERQSRKLSERIGDFIWSMKPGKDEFMTLSSRIRTYAADILGATAIHYTIEIDWDVDTIINDFAARKNILLIMKEGINNAAKYSNASGLYASLSLKENTIHITIKDNGKGFTYTEKAAGNGLGNIRKRVEEMGGTCKIETEPGKGTAVTANIPLP